MSTIVISIDKDSPLISDPQSEEVEIQNIMLNIMSGLKYEYLTEDQISLFKKHGYSIKEEDFKFE